MVSCQYYTVCFTDGYPAGGFQGLGGFVDKQCAETAMKRAVPPGRSASPGWCALTASAVTSAPAVAQGEPEARAEPEAAAEREARAAPRAAAQRVEEQAGLEVPEVAHAFRHTLPVSVGLLLQLLPTGQSPCPVQVLVQ